MTPEDLIITIILTVGGIIGSYFISRHFYIQDQKQKRKTRRRTTHVKKQQSDPLTLKLDPKKPNLGLTEQKVSNTLLALFLQKLFLDKDDAI